MISLKNEDNIQNLGSFLLHLLCQGYFMDLLLYMAINSSAELFKLVKIKLLYQSKLLQVHVYKRVHRL